MTEKLKQHLVPCSYMQFFSYNRDKKKTRDCNVLFLDKKDTKLWIEIRSTKGVFKINDYYTFDTWWNRNIEIEDFLWKIEGLYPDIYKKLITDKTLDDTAFNTLMFFISLQLFRTERGEDLIIQLLGWTMDKEILRKSIIIFAKEITNILSNDFIFCLYKAPQNTNFLTTDTPAFWRHLHSEPLDPGWYEPFEFLFPLSSKYLILAFHKNSLNASKLTSKPRQMEFVECNNIDQAFMDRVNFEIWSYWKHWIISKEQKELDKYKGYKPEVTEKLEREHWNIIFKRIKKNETN